MHTMGTNTDALSDVDLRTVIGAQALDVYEAVALGYPDFDIWFAVGTLGRLAAALEARQAARPAV